MHVQRVVLADDARCPGALPASSTVCISSRSILPTGMPVHAGMTSPTICASTQTRISGVSPCNCSSSACSARPVPRAAAFGIRARSARAAPCLRMPARGCRPRCRSPACREPRGCCSTRSRSFSQRALQFAPVGFRLRPYAWRSRPAARRDPRPPRPRAPARASARRDRRVVRVASSIAGGVAFCPSARRAHAVSSTLTALSGSCRSGR